MQSQTTSSSDSSYRRGVGIMLFNRHKKIFVGRRIDGSSDAWQMPQGGIDDNETEENAAMRELKEETSVTSASIIYKSKELLQYEIPEEFKPNTWDKRYVGQRQRWFLMEFNGTDDEIRLDTENPEFIDWKWADINSLVGLAIYFKKDLYSKVVEEFSKLVFQ